MLVLVAGVLLLNRLEQPPRIIFDETYYVNDARSFLVTGGVEDSFAVHPPVGKWMIASTIWLVGDQSMGWRLAGALSGMGMVLVCYLLALRLFRARWQAALAAVLLTLDGLFLVQARTSMLDIFLALFVLLGAWLLVRDLQDLDATSLSEGALAGRGLRDRWLAGGAFGLAIATKWSGLLALAAALVLVVGFEVLAHRRTRPPGKGVVRLLWVVVGPLLLLPTATYLVTYIPWLVNYQYTTEGNEDCPGAADGTATCEASVGDRLHGLWREHGDILRFHQNLESTHSYRSDPISWPVLARPVAYYYETCREDRPVEDGPCEIPVGTASEVLGLGNPALWWGFLLVLPLLTASMGRRNPSAWVLGGFYGGLYLPWLVVARPAFLFYMAPVVPFMALGMAHAMGRIREAPRDWLPWVAGLGAGVVAAFGARIAGSPRLTIAVAFALGWTLAPMFAAAVWERMRAEPLLVDEETGDVEVADEAPPRLLPWWPLGEVPAASRVPAMVVTGLVVVLVVGVFLWFLPIWTGVPMDPDVLRGRWWFESWI